MLTKNTGSQRIRVFCFDSTTGLPKTGDAANLTAYIAKDFGAVTALGDTSATEEDSTNAKGYYWFDITQTETNADDIMVTAKSSTSNIVAVGSPARIRTVAPNYAAFAIDSSGRVDVGKILGTASQGAAGYVANDMAQAVPTGPTAGTVGEALLMMLNRLGRRGTAQAGTSTTITLDSGASATDNIYSTHNIKIISGTGAGQIANIASYVGSTKVATITRPGGGTWTTNPDNTSVFQIEAVPLAAVGHMLFTALTEGASGRIAAAFQTMFNVASSVFTTASVNQTGDSYARIGAPAGASASADIASIKTDTGTTIPGRLPAALVSGRMDSSVGAMAANVVTAAAIADGAIDRATFAADTGLQSIRSNTAQAGGSTSITLDASASAVTNFYINCLIVTTGGTGAGQARFCTAYNGSTKVATVAAWATNPDSSTTFAIMAFDSVPGATAPTAAAVATAVWQDLLAGSDFSTASSIGKLLKDDINVALNTLATPTNITAGTITTVTNLTNAPTAGDFTSTMKTSLNNATPSVTVSDKTGFSLSAAGILAIWNQLTADAGILANTFAAKLKNWVLGSDSKALLSSDAQTGAVIPHVTLVDTVTALTGNTAQTGDAYAVVNSGTFGNSAIKTAVAGVQSDTDDIQTRLPAALTGAGNLKADAQVVSDKTGYALTSAYDFAKGTVAMAESYNADGAAPTPVQSLFVLMQMLTEMSAAGTVVTVKKLDGTTTAFTLNTNDATTPTSITRAT